MSFAAFWWQSNKRHKGTFVVNNVKWNDQRIWEMRRWISFSLRFLDKTPFCRSFSILFSFFFFNYLVHWLLSVFVFSKQGIKFVCYNALSTFAIIIISLYIYMKLFTFISFYASRFQLMSCQCLLVCLFCLQTSHMMFWTEARKVKVINSQSCVTCNWDSRQSELMIWMTIRQFQPKTVIMLRCVSEKSITKNLKQTNWQSIKYLTAPEYAKYWFR